MYLTTYKKIIVCLSVCLSVCHAPITHLPVGDFMPKVGPPHYSRHLILKLFAKIKIVLRKNEFAQIKIVRQHEDMFSNTYILYPCCKSFFFVACLSWIVLQSLIYLYVQIHITYIAYAINCIALN